jgi:hypothetical protein
LSGKPIFNSKNFEALLKITISKETVAFYSSENRYNSSWYHILRINVGITMTFSEHVKTNNNINNTTKTLTVQTAALGNSAAITFQRIHNSVLKYFIIIYI